MYIFIYIYIYVCEIAINYKIHKKMVYLWGEVEVEVLSCEKSVGDYLMVGAGVLL